MLGDPLAVSPAKLRPGRCTDDDRRHEYERTCDKKSFHPQVTSSFLGGFQARKRRRFKPRRWTGVNLWKVPLQHLAQLRGVARGVILGVIVEDQVDRGSLGSHFRSPLGKLLYFLSI